MTTTATPTIKKRRTTETIAAKDLCVDHRVQRQMVPARVKKIADAMDLDCIGVITINRRTNGTNSIVDGQHRHGALMRLELGDWRVKCDVYHGLDLEDEARLWRRLNNTRRPTAFDDFHAALVEGDSEAVEINSIVESHDLIIHSQKADGTVRAVAALRHIYRGGSKNGATTHPGVLDDTLAVATGAWGTFADATEGQVLQGLGSFLSQHKDEIDRAVLTQKLAKFPGGPRALLGKARGLADLRPGTVPQHLATIVADVYNSHRKVKRLKEAAPST